MDSPPLVSCIMPTRNRRPFVAQAIRYFLRQDYPARELLILDDGDDPVGDLVPEDGRIRYIPLNDRLSVGTKRNLGCEYANGRLIAHWDDDDWMAPNRLGVQVGALEQSGAAICGLSGLPYYSPLKGEAWFYRYPGGARPWIAGGTFLYRKSLWRPRRFPEIDVGEDTGFLWQFPDAGIRSIDAPGLYVGLLHDRNTAPKTLDDRRWERRPLSSVAPLLAADRAFYVALRRRRHQHPSGHERPVAGDAGTPAEAVRDRPAESPLVSCLMPTRDRPAFVAQSVRYFLRQSYPRRELVVVDDGRRPIEALLPDDPRISYLRLSRQRSIGVKRNIACEMARGEVLMGWDDDDWHGARRIEHQVAPILAGRADATGIGECLVYSVSGRQFRVPGRGGQERVFLQGLIGGTLAFHRGYWHAGARFADTSLAEDVAMQKDLLRRGARIETTANHGTFVCIRHADNTWNLSLEDWTRVGPPGFMPAADLDFYRSALSGTG